jgi:arylsulfatase A-like enzyme
MKPRRRIAFSFCLALAMGWLIADENAGVKSSALGANPFAAPGETRPNFLLLLSDDQTFRALGLLGELEVKTPNIDRLARRGMLFTHAFNQGGWSGAVCIPSRMMLNTGRTLWDCRGTNDSIAGGAALWGETMGKAGYATFMAGKWHLPDDALPRSFQTIGPLTGGFLPSTPTDGPAYRRPAANNPWSPDDPQWKGHWLTVNGRVVHSSERIADAAVDYLKALSNGGQKPFFMYVAFNAPHDPRQSPTSFLDLYPAETLRTPPNLLPKHPFLIEESYEGRDEILAPFPRTAAVIQTHLREYYAMVTHLDAQIGRILDALDASGRAPNTIIAFTSDQGLAIGQHGLMGKQNLYDHSLRMPFLMAGPGIPKGTRCDALIFMQSLFATTCEMAGISTPKSVQFPSLVPLVTRRRPALTDAIYCAFLDRQRAVRTDRWKWIRTPSEKQAQLFDVQNDPWEMHNLAGEPEFAAVQNELDARLRALMAEVHDPMPPDRVFTPTRPRPDQ